MEKKNRCWIWGIAIILVVLICATAIYIKMPKRVCHTETKTKGIIVDETIEFSIDSEIICEDGVDVSTYRYSGKKVIWGWSRDKGKVCIAKIRNKTCEIV